MHLVFHPPRPLQMDNADTAIIVKTVGMPKSSLDPDLRQ